MPADNELTHKIVDLYRRICSAIDYLGVDGNAAEEPSSDSEAGNISTSLRSLSVELASLLNLDDGDAYAPEVTDRIRVIEREISTLISRSRSALGRKNCQSL